MGPRLRSLSEDAVDAYTHTWSLLVFLLLAFILLLAPSKHSTNVEQLRQPPIEATCSLSGSFSPLGINYINAFCAGLITNMFRGAIDRYKLYNIPRSVGDDLISIDTENKEGQFVMGSVRDHAAFFLFLLAVCLRLPRMLWSVLSGCCNSVNVGQTLQSVERADLMGCEDRQRKYTGLVKAFMDYTRTDGKTATCLYLVMKVLMIIIILVEIVVVVVFILPETQEFSWHRLVEESYWDYQLPIFKCRLGMNTEVPCYITERQQAADSLNFLADNPTLVSNVFLIFLANLVLLLAINTLNTLLWVVRLVGKSSRHRLGLSKESPMDLVFMIQMARVNLGIGEAVGLAEAASSGQGVKVEGGEEMLLQKRL